MLNSSASVCVQGTNDSSVVSKCSMVDMGYFDDQFISCFVSKKSRRSPLINRGYYVRAGAVQMVVDLFVDSCMSANRLSPIQIIMLGAGFDSLYFRIIAKRQHLTDIIFFEVDFLDVVRRKSEIINANDKLRGCIKKMNCNSEVQLLEDEIVLNSSQYKLIGCDLSDLTKLHSLLVKCEVDFTSPTMCLSECAITYMKTNSSNDLIRWVSQTFSNSMFAVYEQVSPYDGFGRVMCRHFANLNAPLRSVHDYPDIDSIKTRYKNLGWSCCDVIDINTFIDKFISQEEINRIDGLESFDEFEEFHLKCSHYTLMIATKGTVQSAAFTLRQQILQVKTDPFTKYRHMHESNEWGLVKRYGHSSELVGNFIITVGGFGVSMKGVHCRMNDIVVTDKRRGQDFTIQNIMKSKRLFHSISQLADRRLVIIGGRGSPKELHMDIVLVELTNKESDSSLVNDKLPIKITTVECYGTQQRRWRHSATTINIDGREAVFVFGGRIDTVSPPLNDCHILYTDTWQWNEITDDRARPRGRHSHSACLWIVTDRSNLIIVSGGLDSSGKPLDSIHIFDFQNSCWSLLDHQSTLYPRYSHTSHVWNDKLILLGGVSAMTGDPPGIGIIDLRTDYAREISLLPQITSEPFLFYKHSSVLDDESDEIIILGGGGTCFSFGTHFNQSTLQLKLNEAEFVNILC